MYIRYTYILVFLKCACSMIRSVPIRVSFFSLENRLMSASEIRISGKMQCSRHLVKCQICFMKMFMIYVLGLLLFLLYIEDINLSFKIPIVTYMQIQKRKSGPLEGAE